MNFNWLWLCGGAASGVMTLRLGTIGGGGGGMGIRIRIRISATRVEQTKTCSFREVRMRVDEASASALRHPARCYTSSSSRLAASKRAARGHPQQLHSSMRNDGIGPAGTVDPVQLQAPLAPNLHRHVCLLPVRPRRRLTSPASSQEKIARALTWTCASSLAISCHALRTVEAFFTKKAQCVGRQAYSVKHGFHRLSQTLWLAQQRDLSRFSSRGRPNIWTRWLRLRVRVAHRPWPACQILPMVPTKQARHTIRTSFERVPSHCAVLTARG